MTRAQKLSITNTFLTIIVLILIIGTYLILITLSSRTNAMLPSMKKDIIPSLHQSVGEEMLDETEQFIEKLDAVEKYRKESETSSGDSTLPKVSS